MVTGYSVEGSVMKGVHIRYKGTLDFQEIWRLIGDWFESKGFEVIERKAKHKVDVTGEELETAMDAWRNVTDYYRFYMTAYAKYFDAEYVDVVENGKKKRLLKARIHFMVSGKLELDYANRYGKSKLTKQLGKFMNNYVLHWQWDAIYGDQLNYKILELQNVIKEYLGMTVTGSEFADMW